MDHAVSTTDGLVLPEEKLRLENSHGQDQADAIIAGEEARFAHPAEAALPAPKPRSSTAVDTPISETKE